MKEEFVSYEQALALKELGFNEDCLAYFNSKGTLSTHSDEYEVYLINNDKWISSACSAPIKQQVFKWFRDEYKLIAYIEHYAEWNFEIFRIDENIAEVQDDVCFDYNFKGGTYEEAESACIDKLIELIKNK